MNFTTVPVALGERSYDIKVGGGLLLDADAHIAPLLRQKRVVIVTDENVAKLHLAKLEAAMDRAGVARDSIVLPPGEHTKDFSFLQKLLNDMLDRGVERRTMVIALGGGVIGDLTGFAAAVLLRGVEFIQIPTTLLAQVDSSVGGKTAIDTRQGKNLIGAFHQPRLVLADLDALATLPEREFLAGYAEVAKYGLIDDPEFFAWLEANGAKAKAGDTAARQYAVVKSCQAKAAIVARDEKEEGDRALLNLGHTFAHALETELGYGADLLHGEAVAAGMGLAFDFSVRQGLCPAADAERVKRHLRNMGLPAGLKDAGRHATQGQWDASRLIAHMGRDKKVRDGKVTFILARGIGKAFLAPGTDLKAVETMLREHSAA
ncbi:MAG TPA: 3-dehydroquinate synthase [Alphaproteobacteria bacterium]|nr:3-dehydroquinate synthase [Alphaproteobacteria bacterium]